MRLGGPVLIRRPLRSLRYTAPALFMKQLCIFLALALLMLCALRARAAAAVSAEYVMRRAKPCLAGLQDYERMGYRRLSPALRAGEVTR